jgi:2-amino-4-hydroxy-6-hydroxymethyldihydropteridine diphosphokinase
VPEADYVVFVGLGSNLGDREGHLRRAVLELRGAIAIEHISSIWLTQPVGLREQPAFYNAVLSGRTALAPRALLDALLRVEAGMGRRRDASVVPMGPRTIDLDLLLHDRMEVDEPGLTLPHPRMLGRRFVLAPLAEIAPDLWVGPGRRSVIERLAELGTEDAIERLELEDWPPAVR